MFYQSAQMHIPTHLENLYGEAHHQVHPNQVTQWRRQLVEQAATVFAGKSAGGDATAQDREMLLAKIGSLTVERDFLSRAFGK